MKTSHCSQSLLVGVVQKILTSQPQERFWEPPFVFFSGGCVCSFPVGEVCWFLFALWCLPVVLWVFQCCNKPPIFYLFLVAPNIQRMQEHLQFSVRYDRNNSLEQSSENPESWTYIPLFFSPEGKSASAYSELCCLLGRTTVVKMQQYPPRPFFFLTCFRLCTCLGVLQLLDCLLDF